MGQDKPVADITRAAGRKLNRRVGLIVSGEVLVATGQALTGGIQLSKIHRSVRLTESENSNRKCRIGFRQ
jgi:hypothetical protein